MCKENNTFIAEGNNYPFHPDVNTITFVICFNLQNIYRKCLADWHEHAHVKTSQPSSFFW